jgi:hypothetical protein
MNTLIVNKKHLFFLLSLLAVWTNGWGGDSAVGVSPKSLPYLDVFERAEVGSHTAALGAGAIKFPIDILESQNGFLRIELQGRVAWIKASQVRIKPSVPAGCVVATGDGRPTTGVSGGTPGAGATQCK